MTKETKILIEQIMELLRWGLFNLWARNDANFLDRIPEDAKESGLLGIMQEYVINIK